MSTVDEIQSAISHLPEADKQRLRSWFIDMDDGAWDKQIETDSDQGRLDFLVDEALSELKHGKTREL